MHSGQRGGVREVQVGLMGAFEYSHIVVVPADQVRRHRQQLEISSRQRCRPIGARQRPECTRPFLPLVVRATAFEFPVMSVTDPLN